MGRRRSVGQRVLFPWEARTDWERWLGWGGLKPFALVASLGLCVLVVGARERDRAGVRLTRASLLHAREAVERYLADHEGNCPASLKLALTHAARGAGGVDAWGQPLRLRCPAQNEDVRFELMSDGQDGEPGGLDRIE